MFTPTNTKREKLSNLNRHKNALELAFNSVYISPLIKNHFGQSKTNHYHLNEKALNPRLEVK